MCFINKLSPSTLHPNPLNPAGGAHTLLFSRNKLLLFRRVCVLQQCITDIKIYILKYNSCKWAPGEPPCSKYYSTTVGSLICYFYIYYYRSLFRNVEKYFRKSCFIHHVDDLCLIVVWVWPGDSFLQRCNVWICSSFLYLHIHTYSHIYIFITWTSKQLDKNQRFYQLT